MYYGINMKTLILLLVIFGLCSCDNRTETADLHASYRGMGLTVTLPKIVHNNRTVTASAILTITDKDSFRWSFHGKDPLFINYFNRNNVLVSHEKVLIAVPTQFEEMEITQTPRYSFQLTVPAGCDHFTVSCGDSDLSVKKMIR